MTMIAARGVPSGRAQYAAKSPSPSSGVIVSISVILALLGYGARGRAAIVWWPGRRRPNTRPRRPRRRARGGMGRRWGRDCERTPARDRKSVVSGKRVSIRVALGGRRLNNRQKQKTTETYGKHIYRHLMK